MEKKETSNEQSNRQLETLTPAELIKLLKKLKGHAELQTDQKQIAEELYHNALKEKDELKSKALVLVQRCKELEKKLADKELDNKEIPIRKPLDPSRSISAYISPLTDEKDLDAANERIAELELQLHKMIDNENVAKLTAAESVKGKNDDLKIKSELTEKIEILERSLAETGTELTKYKVAMEKAVSKLKELKLTKEEKNAECSTLKARIQELESLSGTKTENVLDTKSIEAELKVYDNLKNEKIKSLEQQITLLNVLVAEKSQCNLDALLKINELENGIASRISEITTLMGNINSLQNEISVKANENLSLDDRIRELEKLLTSNSQDIKISADRIINLENQLLDKAQELEQSLSEKKEIHELTNQISLLEAEIVKKSEEGHKSVEHIQYLEIQVASRSQKVADAWLRIEQLEEEVSIKAHNIIENNENIQELQKTLNNQELIISKANRHIEELTQQLNKAIAGSDSAGQLAAQLLALESEIKKKSEALEDSSLHAKRLDQEIQSKSQEVLNISNRVQQLEQEVAITSQAATESTLVVQKLEQELQERSSRIAHLEEELEKSSTTILSLEQDITIKTNAMENANKEIEQIKTQLEQAAASNDLTTKLQHQLLSLQSEAAEKSKSLDDAKDMINELQEKVSKSTVHMKELEEELKSKNEDAAVSIAKLQSELLRKTHELEASLSRVKDLELDASTATSNASIRIEELTQQLNKAIAGSDSAGQLEAQLLALESEIKKKSEALEDSLSFIQKLQGDLLEFNSVKDCNVHLQTTLSLLQTELTNKSAEALESYTRIDKLEQDVVRRTDAAKKAFERIKELEKETTMNSNAMTEAHSKIEAQSLQLSAARKEASSLQVERENDLIRIEHLEKEIVSHSKKLVDNLSLIAQVEEEASGLTKQLNQARQDVDGKDQELSIAMARIIDLQTIVNNNDDIIIKFNNTVGELQSQIKSDLDRIRDLEKSNAALLVSLHQKDNDSNDLAMKLELLTNNITNNTNNKDVIVTDYKSLASSLLLLQQEVSQKANNPNNITHHNISIDIINNNIAAYDGKLIVALGNIEELKQKVEKLKKVITSKNKHIQKLTDDNASVRNDINERWKEISASIDSNTIIHDLQKVISDRESQIETYVEFIQRTETDINNFATLKNQNEQLLAIIKIMKSAKLASLSAPSMFEVLLRVTYNNENWCLINRNKSPVEIEMEKLEKLELPESIVSWYREQEVLAWRDSERNDSTSTFSINENEFPVIPSTLQELMIQSFESEKEVLMKTISDLEKEKDQSFQVFEKFRERARQSLLKSANEQQSVENKIVVLNEQLATEKDATIKALSSASSLTSSYKEKLSALKRIILKDKLVIDDLRSLLNLVKEEMIMISDNQRKSLSSITVALAKQLNAEDKLQEIRVLHDRIASLEANEKRLLADIKKRGDLARQMIQEKDNEIKRLSNSNVSSMITENRTTSNSTTATINSNISTETSNDMKLGNINAEQSFIYLRQAFSAFTKAKRDVELENLGKIILI